MVRRGNGIDRAVPYLCEGEARIRRTLAAAGTEAVLDAALAAIRSGTGVREGLDGVHDALRRAGHAKGLYGELRGAEPVSPASSFPGLGRPAQARAAVYACPGGRCRRLELGKDAMPAPVCAVDGGPMRLSGTGTGSGAGS
ncbi:hypothetical protein [Kitasatospora sp. NPDC015120]|uniref:hypothetical protein n=1 Tax=Kitasatospora sp. NPDC015120 TaxID=3364023 RepID=UPI0036F49E5A